MNESDLISKYLNQHWIHSHEEDTASETVFRPATYKFPRSRGRVGYEFKPNGKCTVTGFGPDDRSQKRDSKWELKITDPKEITVTLESGEIRVLRLITVMENKLVVLKE